MFARSKLVSSFSTAALACLVFAAPAAQATMVRIPTALGPVDIELFDTGAPLTVANFLAYVRNGAYNNTFFHRSVAGFIVQGGGFMWVEGAAGQPAKVPALAPVVNEFSATRSNLRGTVAMAKLGGNPDSATSEWFVNLANNASNLDNQNGGFTVFGRVTAPGMVVMDAVAALRKLNASSCNGALTDLPIIAATFPTSCAAITANTSVLVMTNGAKEIGAVQTLSDSERIFNYLEAAYPQYAAPASPPSATALGYLYRYYSKTNAYVGTKDGNVYYLVPAISPDITLLGTVAQWRDIAVAAGY